MSSSDHSTYSSSETVTPLTLSHGTQRVKYQSDDDWDFHLDMPLKPIDISLALPHYRARNQPVDHRMCMFIGGETAPIRARICRYNPRSKFYLEIQGGASDVTVWLPSDFRGNIHHSSKATFSAGFVNRILPHVRLNESGGGEDWSEDDVVVSTRGRITFRMWDIQTCAPENGQVEALKRMFGRVRKAPETTIDWDFLLDD